MKGYFYKRSCKCDPKNCICIKKWAFVIDIGKNPETGKRKQKTKGGFKTRQKAEAVASALITEINRGKFIEESNILFKDWVDEWLPLYIDKTGAKPGTIRLRKYNIRKLLHYFAHFKLGISRRKHIKQY